MRRSIEIKCPKCITEQSAFIFGSINVSNDPNLKELLFQGQINNFKCEKCGTEATISTPLFYHDMNKQILVQFFPPDLIENDNFLEHFIKEIEAIYSRYPYAKQTHIVFDMTELLRYIIFRDRLHEKKAKLIPNLC